MILILSNAFHLIISKYCDLDIFSNELKCLSTHFAISTLPCFIITALTLLASSKTFRINKGNSISRVPQVHKVSLRYMFHLNFQNVYLNVIEGNCTCMCCHILQL